MGDEKENFTREELWEIEARCTRMTEIVINPNWIRAYQDLRHAACCLDAFIARSSVGTVIVEGVGSGDQSEPTSTKEG